MKPVVTTNAAEILLPLYLVAYFGAAFFWRSFIGWKKTGINPAARDLSLIDDGAILDDASTQCF